MKRPLTDREVNTLLCALRGMYADVDDDDAEYGPRRCSSRTCDHFDDGPSPLTRAEADALAEELGLGMSIESSTVNSGPEARS